MHQSDPEWATLLVLDALASLPVLEYLHLHICWSLGSPVLFQRLSNLKKLTLTSPNKSHRTYPHRRKTYWIESTGVDESHDR